MPNLVVLVFVTIIFLFFVVIRKLSYDTVSFLFLICQFKFPFLFSYSLPYSVYLRIADFSRILLGFGYRFLTTFISYRPPGTRFFSFSNFLMFSGIYYYSLFFRSVFPVSLFFVWAVLCVKTNFCKLSSLSLTLWY